MVPQVLHKISTNVIHNRSASCIKIGFTNVTYDCFHKRYSYICAYVCIYACMYVCYACMLCMLVMYVYALLFKLGPQALLKTDFMRVTQNWSHESYSILVPWVLLKISFTKVTQNCFHECYSKLIPQVLLKIGFTSGTTLKNLLACNVFID